MLYAIENLKKTYDGRTVLDLPQLSIRRGKIYALLGPNGSGKTTLLHILGFLSAPTSGSLHYNNRPVAFNEKALQALRREVVLVNQHPILFTASVHANVEFGLKIRGISGKQRRRIVEEALEMVGMRDFMSAGGQTLSGGETQRVAIARALACEPRVILLDEPTASVDAASQAVIERIIGDIHAHKGISVILCTHDMRQAARLTDEKICLLGGRQSAGLHENIFSGRLFSEGGRRFCRVNEDTAIPVQTSRDGEIRISVKPRALKIIAPDFSIQNSDEVLEGRIDQLVREKEGIRVLTDVGVPLHALVPEEDFRRLGITVGDRIRLQCPPGAVEIL